jgi:F0F1-type ATP synthase membrane subunit b/b'
MLGQVDQIVEQLATQGGGWGVMGAMLWIGWRVWRELKPHLVETLSLRTREVKAREDQAEATKAQADSTAGVMKSVEGLRGSVDSLADKVEKVVNNGFSRITEKVVAPVTGKKN